MEFSGTFELADAEVEEVWLALSDPAMIQHALRGCKFVVRVDDDDPDFDALREEHLDDQPELTADPGVIAGRAFREGETYAALVEANVGNVNPSFETVVAIDEREQPRMAASGEGSAGNSSFEMASGMELSETDDGVAVDWNAEANVFGRLAQMGQRMIGPVANRMVKQFFRNLQDQIESLETGADEPDATHAAGAAAIDRDAESTTEGADESTTEGDTERATEGTAGSTTGEADEPTPTGDVESPGEGVDEPSTEGGAVEQPAESVAEPDEGPLADDADIDEETGGEGGFVARLKRLVGLG